MKEVEYLRSLNVPVDLFVINRKIRNAYVEDMPEIAPIFISDRRRTIRFSPRFPIFNYFSAYHLVSAALPNQLIDKRYDFVISHGSTTTLTAYALFKRRGIPYVAFIWDPMIYILEKVYGRGTSRGLLAPLSPLIAQVEKTLLGSASAVVTCSRVHSTLLSERYATNPSVIYPGVDSPDGTNGQIGDKIIAFTRWERAKNPTMLLEILERIPQASLLMAGSWRSEKELSDFQRDSARRGLGGRVKILGYYNDKEISKICAQGRVWVHPNFEAFGIGGLEAASRGCPIMIPKGSGVTELFNEGEHGFFPLSADLDEWKRRILELINDTELAWKMGQSAQKVAKKFSWSYHSECLLALLQELVSGRGPPSKPTPTLPRAS